MIKGGKGKAMKLKRPSKTLAPEPSKTPAGDFLRDHRPPDFSLLRTSERAKLTAMIDAYEARIKALEAMNHELRLLLASGQAGSGVDFEVMPPRGNA